MAASLVFPQCEQMERRRVVCENILNQLSPLPRKLLLEDVRKGELKGNELSGQNVKRIGQKHIFFVFQNIDTVKTY